MITTHDVLTTTVANQMADVHRLFNLVQPQWNPTLTQDECCKLILPLNSLKELLWDMAIKRNVEQQSRAA